MTNISNKINILRNYFERSFLSKIEQMRDSSPLWKACEYSIIAPGKRIRPVLVFLVGEMLGIEPVKLQSFAAAVEFLHNSSLVHDDLPALDNDDYRRGRLTCHKQFNESTALLAGNALIALAFELIVTDENLTDKEKTELSQLLSRAFYKLCIGQVMDLDDTRGQKRNKESFSAMELFQQKQDLEIRHLHKTGALITACMLGPGTLYSGKPFAFDLITELSRIGEKIGLLFQITDDILDSISEEQTLSQDEEQGISTYVSLYGLEGAKTIALKEATEAKELLAAFGPGAKDLIEMVEFILNRDK